METISIYAGSSSDQFFTGGVVWGPSNDPTLSALDLAYQNLRYGLIFSYAIPVPFGSYIVQVGAIEPNKSGPGQRIYSVQVNERRTDGIDLFALVGLKTPYLMEFLVTVDSASPLIRVNFSSKIGNAVVSYIQIDTQSFEGTGPLST